MLSRRLLKNLDFTIIIITVIILIIGLVIIGSATHINTPGEDRYWYVQRQGLFAVINIAIILAMLQFDYKILGRYANVLYGINLVMLLAVMFIGQSALGAPTVDSDRTDKFAAFRVFQTDHDYFAG